MGTLTIGLFSSLIGSMNSDFALKLAETAIAKGHKVNMWFSGNSTMISNKGQKEFKDYSHLEKRLKELIGKGMEVVSCEACSMARGVPKENLVEGVKSAAMDWYLARAAAGDRVLHIGVE